jgi:hypothetical protein
MFQDKKTLLITVSSSKPIVLQYDIKKRFTIPNWNTGDHDTVSRRKVALLKEIKHIGSNSAAT